MPNRGIEQFRWDRSNQVIVFKCPMKNSNLVNKAINSSKRPSIRTASRGWGYCRTFSEWSQLYCCMPNPWETRSEEYFATVIKRGNKRVQWNQVDELAKFVRDISTEKIISQFPMKSDHCNFNDRDDEVRHTDPGGRGYSPIYLV